MAIIDQILRLEAAANIIKDKTAELELDKVGGGKISPSDNLTVQADAINNIEKGTPVTRKLTSSSTSVSLPKGYYGSTSSVSVDVMSAHAVTLSGSSQTIACKDKVMSGDITIPAANVYRTGSSEPTSSTPGNNGDLYLVI